MSELYNWTKFYKLLAISTFGSWVNHTTMREVYILEELLASEEEQTNSVVPF